MSRIAHPEEPLRDINKAHCRTLAKSLQNYNNKYVRGMTTVFFHLTLPPKCVTYGTAMQNVDEVILLKDGYYMVMLEGRQRHRFADILRDDDSVECVTRPMSLLYEILVD